MLYYADVKNCGAKKGFNYIYIYIYIYRERERERWVQVTSDVTLKSHTFFKLLDLSKSNGQEKKTPH